MITVPMLMEELEPRILHSADLSPLYDGGDNLAVLQDHQQSLPDNSDVEPASLNEDTNQNIELVFVDTATPDYQLLLDDLMSTADESRSLEVVLIDSGRDGIGKITEALAGRSNIEAIHIVSHGSEGELSLGTDLITAESMDDEHADALETIGQSLSDTADILIYGCNFGQGELGREAAEKLAQLTGADVAASDDLTGHASLGGDWDLEFHIGDIDDTVTFGAQAWHGVLATFTVDTFNDTVDANPGDGLAQDASGNTSLRAAIMEANALAGVDVIDLASGTYTLTIAGTNENAASQGDLDISSEIKIVGAGAGSTVIDANKLDRVFDIQFAGDATISGVTIQNGDNVAQGGGIKLSGGGGGARLTLDDVIVSGNTASSEGGGIYNDGTLTVTNSTLSGNNTAPQGGGLFNVQDAYLTGVTISGNSADFGGGINNANQGITLSLTNVTISGNTATSQGGGIFTAKSADLTNATVAFNSASVGGGIYVSGGQGDAVLKNTILANNTGNNANAALTSLGYNIDSDGTAGLTDPSDQSGTVPSPLDPLLGALADNGGPTPTHALLAGSPAINPAGLTGAPTTDQRGFLRSDGSPDIGAYEFNAAPSSGFWISTEGDVASPSGVKGLDAWVDGDVLQFGDPDLALEPGGSDGTLSRAFNLDMFAVDGAAEIDAIHYVSSDITVGGSTTMNLQAGDVLFSTVLLESAGFSSTNTIGAVQDSDLVLFRPDTVGDYSSGTFQLLLDQSTVTGGNNWLNLAGISLVEKDTVVGDTTLRAGSFILVEGAAGSRRVIQLFTPTSVGAGTTDGSLAFLLDTTVPAVGMANPIDGLELIETTTTVGGETLAAGTILISEDADASIYALDVTATELGTGSAASVSLLLDGAAVGLETAAENTFALTLLQTSTSFNSAPVVAAPAAPLAATEQTALAIHGSGFTVKDVDAAAGALLATLSVGEGTITVVEGDSGVIVTGGNGTATVTLSGSIAEIDSLLTGAGTGTITYFNNADAPNASTTLTVTVNDQGNSGIDPGLSGDAFSEEGSASVTIKISGTNDAPVFTSSGPYSVDENASAGTVVGTVVATDPDIQGAGAALIISEIMYNPASSEPGWEWIEVYNPTSATIDLAGYVLDDINTLAHTGANIAAGSVASGSTAVLFNADAISTTDFEAAWASGINLIAVTGWADLQLNNDGDTVSLWASFADYSGDHLTHANALVTVSYDDLAPWPAPDGAASIFLTDLSADPTDGANWALGTIGAPTPLGDLAYQSTAAAGNSGADVGSPGDGGSGTNLSYAITGNVDPDGDTNFAFSIDANTGVITVNDADDLDYETNTSFAITVEVTDGTSPTSTSVTIDLNNINEAPSATAPASIGVTEDLASAIICRCRCRRQRRGGHFQRRPGHTHGRRQWRRHRAWQRHDQSHTHRHSD
jgi:CSLREA domain-containing protein